MIGNFIIRKGATQPWLDVQLTKDGLVDLSLEAPKPKGCGEGCGDASNIIDLTDAQVRFLLYKCGRTPALVATTGQTVVLSPECGQVEYRWAPGDLTDECLYYGTFEVIFKDGTVLLWPYEREMLAIEVL